MNLVSNHEFWSPPSLQEKIKKFPTWWLTTSHVSVPAISSAQTAVRAADPKVNASVEMQHLRFNRCNQLGVRAGFRKKKFHGVGSAPAQKRGLSKQTRAISRSTCCQICIPRPRLFLIMSDPGSSRASNVASRWKCCWLVLAGCQG